MEKSSSKMILKINSKYYLLFLLLIIFITDYTCYFNIPFLRQIFGFIFLTFLPGFILIHFFNINNIGTTVKCVLSVGLSVSFVMFSGLLLNTFLPLFGYQQPLSAISLLLFLNSILILLITIILYRSDYVSTFTEIQLSRLEKIYLIVPVLLPALSIFGIYQMNITNNNMYIILLLLIIPIYIISICLFNYKFPQRLYPFVIWTISISLLLLMALRSNYIIGYDAHQEYIFFRRTLESLYWTIQGDSLLDATLSISLLPTIYASIINSSPELIFKIFSSLLFSVSPVVVFAISNKYIGKFYSFLASLFFIFQANFLTTAANARTNIAILFCMLFLMTLFNDKINSIKKTMLLIVFLISIIVSHYSTAYIFLIIILATYVGTNLLSRKYDFKNVFNFNLIMLCAVLIFFWYSQITQVPFDMSVKFISNIISAFNDFFREDMRSSSISAMLGSGITQKGIPHKIEFLFTWLSFVLIGLGILTLVKRRKEMSFAGLHKPEYLTTKFEIDFFLIALVCVGLLFVMVIFPNVSMGYSTERLYGLTSVVLCIFFVIGGIVFSKYLNRLIKFIKIKGQSIKTKEIQPYIILLLVLIPYYFCVTGVTYQMFGFPRSVILNERGETSDFLIVHDQEVIGAKWLNHNCTNVQDNETKNIVVHTDYFGDVRILSGWDISNQPLISKSFFLDNNIVTDGYIYLRYTNVVSKRVYPYWLMNQDIEDLCHLYINKAEIYNNGGSEIWI
jgi:uncharacterized membrane protein